MSNGVNRTMNRSLRRILYSLKRQYGGRVHVYKLSAAATAYATGVKSYTRTMTTVNRCIVLPVKIQREAVQNISIISANKSFVYGGSYDAGTRLFILDARDLTTDYEVATDDWLVYDGRRYDMKTITELEQHTGWLIVGKEVKGVQPEQIFKVRPESWLEITDTAVLT